MQKALKVSAILSWFNLIVWGLLVGTGILQALFSGNILVILIIVLFGSIPLHSYASLQLHKSIKNPDIPLSNQTSVAIRFIGLVALFFGICFFIVGLAILQNTRKVVTLLESQGLWDLKGPDLYHFMIKTAVFYVVTGLPILINVFLSFRLLRWYLFSRENEIK